MRCKSFPFRLCGHCAERSFVRHKEDVRHTLEKFLFFRRFDQFEIWEPARTDHIVFFHNHAGISDGALIAYGGTRRDRFDLAVRYVREYERHDLRRIGIPREPSSARAGEMFPERIDLPNIRADLEETPENICFILARMIRRLAEKHRPAARDDEKHGVVRGKTIEKVDNCAGRVHVGASWKRMGANKNF